MDGPGAAPGRAALRGTSSACPRGAKCAAPDRPVVCFLGDGAFYYHLAELETAMRYGIKTVTIVNNNESFNQEAFLWGGVPAFEANWKFAKVDFVQLAESFGAAAFRVEQPDDFEAAFLAAMAADTPAVVEVRTDQKVVVPSSWAPRN